MKDRLDDAPDPPPDGRAGPGDRTSLSILLAEDGLVNQKVAASLLTQRGHRVEIAGNGIEALAALQSRDFDVVLMDVEMPEMDGLEATARIRDRERGSGTRVPVIAMTAHSATNYREQCEAVGMDGYVAKPFLPEQLFEVVEGAYRRCASPPQNLEDAVGDEVLDLAAALARVGGNAASLRGLAELFSVEAPKLMARVREAVEAGSPEDLVHPAHTLKGTVGLFAASRCVDLARSLEGMGRDGDLTGAPEALVSLEREIASLDQALDALRHNRLD